MNIVKIKGIELGKGSPKICVPVTGRTKEEIRLRLEELQEAEPDLAEWRADWYEGVFDREKLEDELAFLRRELGNMPLLVTFRTKEEGGEQEISREAYEKFLRQVISSGHADLIDVELFRGEELLAEICREAHQAGVKAVASSHDFNGTPEKEEMIRRLCPDAGMRGGSSEAGCHAAEPGRCAGAPFGDLGNEGKVCGAAFDYHVHGRHRAGEPAGGRNFRIGADLWISRRCVRAGTDRRRGAESCLALFHENRVSA